MLLEVRLIDDEKSPASEMIHDTEPGVSQESPVRNPVCPGHSCREVLVQRGSCRVWGR